MHIPTNIVVTCQSERSQFQNRDTAMRMLKSKLLAIKEKEEREKMANIKGTEMENGFRKSDSFLCILSLHVS